MASLQASSSLMFSSSSSDSSCCCSSRRVHVVNAAISLPKLPKINFSTPKIVPSRGLGLTNTIHIEKTTVSDTTIEERDNGRAMEETEITKLKHQLYVILEAVCDRVEMHKNIGVQRDNWNKLLLNSINMITLTAATMAGVAATGAGGGGAAPSAGATLLFSGATGMMVLVNKMQPSQLAEEQRNAERLFKQLQREIETVIALRVPCEQDVEEAMEKVLALDKAYPLPLLGDKMIDKFPKTFKPAVWWPSKRLNRSYENTKQNNKRSEEMQMEMREIIQVLKTKDREDYERLGNLVLKINKFLAVSGPLLAGIAAAGSAFAGSHSSVGTVAAAAGALATVVNSFEHGGQVGMVLEMYRNSAGFFTQLEESIESSSEDAGEVLEMKVALKLGRSMSELRELAMKSTHARVEGTQMEEFASKLF